jgi:hypothetical protein
MGFVRLFLVSLYISMFLILTACGGKLPGFRVLEKSDTFQQASVTNNEVDMLFVIDNSGSMQDEQDSLAESFESFITEFADRELNFHIGIISTDNISGSSRWSSSNASGAYYGIYNNQIGSLLSKYSSYRWISPETPDLVNKFKNNVRLGINGSGYEMPLSVLVTSIDKAATGQWNEGFFREDAFLAVVVVTDEDEADSTTHDISVSNYPSTMATRLTNLENKLNTLKGSAANYSLYAITSPSPAQCPSAYQTGTAVMAAATRFGGETGNICNDFSTTLNHIGGNILSRATRFHLLQPPDGDIRIYVNGVEYPKDSTHTNGWDYLAASQDVEFYGNYIPPSGSSISVTYVPAAPTN